MKSNDLNLFTCMIVMTVCAGCLFGQYVETTIPVPDSFCGTSRPFAIEYNPVTNRIYFGGWGDRVIVVDALIDQKIAAIDYTGIVTSIACNRTRNKIYVAGYSKVAVIDGATNQVVKIIPFDTVYAIAYNPNNDHLYLFNMYYGAIVDCQTDSIIKTLNLTPCLNRMACLNPDLNKLYFVDYDDILVIDCETDSVIHGIGAWYNPVFLIYNNISNKMYYGYRNSSNRILVIDCALDYGWYIYISHNPVAASFNPTTNKLYVSGESDRTMVIDGIGDSVIYEIPNAPASGIGCDPIHNKIYCSVSLYQWMTAVYDGQSDTLIKNINVPKPSFKLQFASGTSKLYGISRYDAMTPVIDCVDDTLLEVIKLGGGPSFLCFAGNNKVYCGDSSSSDITVIDAALNQVIKVIDLGCPPGGLTYNTVSNKIYASAPYNNRLFVIDCDTDSFTMISSGIFYPGALEYNPQNNKIYCATSPNYVTNTDTITVIDGSADTVITKIPAERIIRELIYDSDDNQIYCSSGGFSLVAIDGETNAIIDTIAVPGGSGFLAYNPVNNKVYTTHQGINHMSIIDCNINQVVDSVYVGYSPMDVIYHSTNNMVYCNSWNSGIVTAVNGTTDSVEAVIHVGDGPSGMISDPVFNRIYCARSSSDSVAIINGQNNTVTKTLQVGTRPCTFARNPYTNRIYVANNIGSSISVIRDGAEVEEIGPTAAVPLRLILAPNPGHDIITVRIAGLENRLTDVNLTMYDAAGRAVKTVKIPASVNRMKVDVSDLPAGVYFIGNESGTENGFQKLVITR